MIEIQVFELTGLPATAEARTRVVEDCFATSTFHVEVPEKNRYFVARVTKAVPPAQQYSAPDGGFRGPDGKPSIRKLIAGADDAMIERVFAVMRAMVEGPVDAKVINAAAVAAAPAEVCTGATRPNPPAQTCAAAPAVEE
jgi:hypothetical protein